MPSDPLANLKDIHLPPAINAWPPAPGWIGLMLLGIGVGISSGVLLYRCYQRNRPIREALRLLTQYQKDYEATQHVVPICSQLNALLKRLCLTYYPREAVAHLHGHAWILFLNQTGKQINFTPVASYLTLTLYTRDHSTCITPPDLTPLFTLIRAWIKQHRSKRCCN